MAPRRQDLHHLRGHLRDPAPGHLTGAPGHVATSEPDPEAQRAERKAERGWRLAEAALELFSERGFDHTSVDDIVGAARTSKSAFYEHWSSREDCLRWLLDRLGERIVLEVAEHAAVVEDPVERLRRGLAGFVQACARDHRLARLLLVESVGVGGPVEDSRRDIQDRFVRLAAAQLRDAARAGDGYAIDPVVFGRAVVGATQEAAAMLIAQPALDPKDVIDGLSAVFARPALAP